MKKTVILAILDGWGISFEKAGNAIANASTPNMTSLLTNYPCTILQASGIAAGLPWGKMGNSEVGHLILGAGKTIYQSLPKVTLSIQDRTFFENDILQKCVDNANKYNSNIHVMGLLSDGGVHSHIDHLYAILEYLQIKQIKSEKVLIHAFTDGRDTDPRSSIKYLSELTRNMKEEGWPGRIASIMGRYYAMDRNKNWERTKLSYKCLVNLEGIKELDPRTAVEKLHSENITDEFIKPIIFADKFNNYNKISSNDSALFFNIREDRARQLTQAFISDDFKGFDRGEKLKNLCFATMIEYEKGLTANVVFPPENVELPLGKVLSEYGIVQLRIAETEKYAHVTYFFNGGRETPFDNEFRTLIPSPSVSTYDKAPEMSAEALTETVINNIESKKYNFILLNYANADMVGHTGNFKQVIKAIECVDKCIGKLFDCCKKNNVILIITADHGNAEEKFNPKTGEVITEHSTNPVPFIIVSNDNMRKAAKNFDDQTKIGGMLCDVAPTILEIFDIPKPSEMTGRSLLEDLE